MDYMSIDIKSQYNALIRELAFELPAFRLDSEVL